MPWINDGEGNFIWAPAPGESATPTTPDPSGGGGYAAPYQPAGTQTFSSLADAIGQFGGANTLPTTNTPTSAIDMSALPGNYHGYGMTRDYVTQTLAQTINDGEGNQVQAVTGRQRQALENALSFMNQYGVNSVAELPVEAQTRIEGVFGVGQAAHNMATLQALAMLAVPAAGAGAFGGGAAGTAATAAPAVEGYGGLSAGTAGTAGTAGAGTAASTGTAATAAGLGEETLASTGSFGTGANAAAPTGGSPGLGAFTGTPAATGTGAGTGVAPAAATAASGSALSRILEGNGTTDDWLRIVGTGVDIYGANRQANASEDLANRYFNMGAPYRDELSRISADPQAFYDSPTAKSATESVLRRLSATHGNVAGSPYAQALTVDALYDQYGNERDRLARFGGLSAFNSAAPGADATAVGADANLWNSISGGIADITTPRNRPFTLQDIMRAGGYI